jgi:hypothetical protein
MRTNAPSSSLHGLLDQVQPTLDDPGPIAIRTDTADDQAVPVALEALLAADFAYDGFYGWVLKLDDLVTAFAVQVIVLRVAVIVFKKSPRAHLQPPQQAGINELGQGPINGSPTCSKTLSLDGIDELVGVEMAVLTENVTDQVALLAGETLRPWPARKVLAKLFLGTLCHFDCWQLHDWLPPGPIKNQAMKQSE